MVGISRHHDAAGEATAATEAFARFLALIKRQPADQRMDALFGQIAWLEGAAGEDPALDPAVRSLLPALDGAVSGLANGGAGPYQ